MSMQIEISAADGAAVMRLSGRFDYTTRNDFIAGVEEVIPLGQAGEIKVDLGGLSYIDSSALGMLLMMRDRGRKFGKTICLANARGAVRQVLDTAQFERLFRVV
jgi:anti-anti-sigma factor